MLGFAHRMKYRDFKIRCEQLTSEFDETIGREYGRDAIGHWVRQMSIPVVYLCYISKIKAQWVLFAHFVSDGIALVFVYKNKPLIALSFWLFAHFLDNIDGQLARMRDETDMKWGKLDIHLHLIANMLFWVIINAPIVLAGRVICEVHRNRLGEDVDSKPRWGEQSKLWYWLSKPTDINMMYLGWMSFALMGKIEYYVMLYSVYYVIIALGQSVKWMQGIIFAE